MNGTTYTTGSLALALETARPAFTVVDGSKMAVSVPAPAAAARTGVVGRVLRMACAVALVAGAVLIGLSSLSSGQRAYDAAIASSARMEITVQRDDTLWSIAQEHPAQGVSTRDTVDIVRTWNGLSDGMLRAGQTLVVPSR